MQDWLAEEIGLELVVAFRRTIALLLADKSAYFAGLRQTESPKPENRADCTVQDRQVRNKRLVFFLSVHASPLWAGYSAGTDKRTDWMVGFLVDMTGKCVGKTQL